MLQILKRLHFDAFENKFWVFFVMTVFFLLLNYWWLSMPVLKDNKPDGHLPLQDRKQTQNLPSPVISNLILNTRKPKVPGFPCQKPTVAGAK